MWGSCCSRFNNSVYNINGMHLANLNNHSHLKNWRLSPVQWLIIIVRSWCSNHIITEWNMIRSKQCKQCMAYGFHSSHAPRERLFHSCTFYSWTVFLHWDTDVCRWGSPGSPLVGSMSSRHGTPFPRLCTSLRTGSPCTCPQSQYSSVLLLQRALAMLTWA